MASAHPHHRFRNLKVVPFAEKVEKRRGRPKKDEPLYLSFKIEAEIEIDEDTLCEEREKLGRFVLASNQTDLEPELMLNYYKGQQTVERGFRFLKDKSFHVSEVYLKKEERIESLCMIMVLSLLIYSFAEWRLRERLRETGQTVPNQLNKPTQRPTMRWIFEIFMGVIQSVRRSRQDNQSHCASEHIANDHFRVAREGMRKLLRIKLNMRNMGSRIESGRG
jgi:transposase